MPTASRKRANTGPATVPLDLPSYVQLHECSHELMLATAHDVLLVAWRSPMTVERIQRIEAFTTAVRREIDRFCVLSVVEPDIVAPPDTATRDAAAQLTSTFENCCGGVALAIEGTGLKYLVVRMAIATINFGRVAVGRAECVRHGAGRESLDLPAHDAAHRRA